MLMTDRDRVLLERLNRHPQMRARVESLLAVVEDAAGDCERADAAERRMMEELRQMGHEALTAWENALLLNPTFPTVHRNLALAYYNKRHDPEKAGAAQAAKLAHAKQDGLLPLAGNFQGKQ